METVVQKAEKIGQSTTVKALIIAVMSLLLLIPEPMIENLIRERELRSIETVEKINEKWSNSQLVNGPYLVIPYQLRKTDARKTEIIETHKMYLTPEQLSIKSHLTPEVRHYGIYKSILYKSSIDLKGKFKNPIAFFPSNAEIKWSEAHVRIGISDLRGIANNIDFKLNGIQGKANAGGINDVVGEGMQIAIDNAASLVSASTSAFSCAIRLNGSGALSFIPVGRNTNVMMSGNWNSPGFIGSFTPEYNLDKDGFAAKWNVIHFNRNIPEYWTDNEMKTVSESSFGVSLVDTVDHYQQNMRSAKYALMFIGLTFIVFFFVEIFTRKRIHPIQYLLVGFALVLFYSLLLSLSEQIGFGYAYLISTLSIIGLILVYAYSVFRNITQTAFLGLVLSGLYIFMFVVLQLEDIALLIGSIGLFFILAIIMYISGKIKWYKQDN